MKSLLFVFFPCYQLLPQAKALSCIVYTTDAVSFFFIVILICFPVGLWNIILSDKCGLPILCSTFKKKAPKAIKEIRKFAQKAMGTTDVRVDVKLNKQVWSRGIRSVPRRIRVRVARKRNDEEDAKEEFYSLVTVAEIPPEGLKGLGTKVIDEED